jgi:SAM-dependent methyltransferase
MPSDDVYAPPSTVTDVNDCYFYHTMDVPGVGHVTGEWDLRGGVREYLGGVSFRGKRVLEIGTASGFLSFFMEREGAEVVGFDLSPAQAWDVVPFARTDHARFAAERRAHIRRLNNGYWLCHRAHGSRARMVYGSVYAVPEAIGPVDVATFGSVLLHVRDPFLALQNALRLTRETVVVTEPLWRRLALLGRLGPPSLAFRPDARTGLPRETWWTLTPDAVRAFIAVLGFEDAEVRYHVQRAGGRPQRMFTVVGRRTHGSL